MEVVLAQVSDICHDVTAVSGDAPAASVWNLSLPVLHGPLRAGLGCDGNHLRQRVRAAAVDRAAGP